MVEDASLDEFCDRYCLIGDGPSIKERVDELDRMGVTNLYVRGVHSYEIPFDVLHGFANHVLT